MYTMLYMYTVDSRVCYCTVYIAWSQPKATHSHPSPPRARLSRAAASPMGNVPDTAAGNPATAAGPAAPTAAVRSDLRRQESTHLRQDTTDPQGGKGSTPAADADAAASGKGSGHVDKAAAASPAAGKGGSPAASSDAKTSTSTTAVSTSNARPPSAAATTASAKQVHVADAKEGDRRKFYHMSVKTALVGDTDEPDAADVVKDEGGDKFTAFVKWMKANGAQFPDQHLVKYTEECRGVHAKKDIKEQTQIAYIPLKLLIHEGHGQETAVGSKVWNSPNNNVIVPAHTQVIIYMLLTGAREAARGKTCDSFFAPYYRILPETFDCFPIFWNEEEMGWLAGSDLVQQIRERRRNIVADYHEVSRICPEFGEQFTEDDFLWCRTAVGSRNFGININGVKRTTMVPWADMLNHFRPRETSWTFDNTQQGFTMTSLKALSAGQQIMDSYGKKCNSKFLMHYGFAIEKNREEDGKCMNEMPLLLTLEVRLYFVCVFLSPCRVLFVTSSHPQTHPHITPTHAELSGR